MDKRFVSKALIIASEVKSDGYRKALGLAIGDSKNSRHGTEVFKGLKDRGLQSVEFVIPERS